MRRFFRRSFALGAVALGLFGSSLSASAQDYPKKQLIKLIVAQGPGSATDILARVLANRMQEVLGQRVIVDNRPGAGGLLGTEQAANSPPDGYTLLLASVSTHGVNPAVYGKLRYDPVKDFAPVGMVATTGNVLIVNPDLPIKTVADLIAQAKAQPGKLSFATAGEGSSQHLATELFNIMAGGLKMTHVPYRGTQPGLAGVMGKEVSWMMPAIPSGMTAIKTGLARPIAVTTAKRVAELPDVPTVSETLPEFEVTTWYGLMAPAATPEPVVSALNHAIEAALDNAQARETLKGAGLEPTTSTPKAFGDFVKQEIDRWSRVAKDAKITLD